MNATDAVMYAFAFLILSMGLMCLSMVAMEVRKAWK